MRMIIKGADFSAVSIGKVEKDLSFEYVSVQKLKEFPWKNIINKNAPLPWADGSNVGVTTFLIATSSDTSYTSVTNSSRIVSEFIEVEPGMEIHTNLYNTANCPVIICYDENKNALGPNSTYCLWNTADYSYDKVLTIPNGVKYIVVSIYSIGATDRVIPSYIKGVYSEV